MSIRLQLVSWNVHGTGPTPRVIPRMRAVAHELARRAPDVSLLQEVWSPVQADLLASWIGDGYTRVDTPPRGWPGRVAGLLAFVSRRSGWAVAGRDFEEFEATAPAWKLWEGDGVGRKGILRLDLERDDARLALVNTHLQASYSPGGYTEVRRAQLEQLSRSVATIDPGVPVVVGGDLNVPASGPLYAEISRSFEDLTAPLREACGCGTAVDSSAWLDYVLLRRGPVWSASASVERIVSVREDHPYSDHHGLAAALDLRRAPRAGADPGAVARRILVGPSTRRAWLGAALRLGRRLL
jgi:endonuclease/exonuclease/phosphatase family metal-dependent hydrolase